MIADECRALIEKALAGDAQAAETLLAGVRGPIFNLALRILGEPEAAEDACQEIVMKVWTKLGSYRGEARFSTWALAIASNHLLTAKRSRMEERGISFEAYEAERGQVPAERAPFPALEEQQLIQELKHSCSLGMLQCLDRQDRLVYVLFAFFRVSGQTGSAIAGLSPEAYRQRLSRTRKRMADFLAKVCGLANAGAPCRCQDRIVHALRQGRIRREALYYSTHAQEAAALTKAMESLDGESNVYRMGSVFRPREEARTIRQIIAEAAPDLL